jgi:hypothetical protein
VVVGLLLTLSQGSSPHVGKPASENEHRPPAFGTRRR